MESGHTRKQQDTVKVSWKICHGTKTYCLLQSSTHKRHMSNTFRDAGCIEMVKNCFSFFGDKEIGHWSPWSPWSHTPLIWNRVRGSAECAETTSTVNQIPLLQPGGGAGADDSFWCLDIFTYLSHENIPSFQDSAVTLWQRGTLQHSR